MSNGLSGHITFDLDEKIDPNTTLDGIRLTSTELTSQLFTTDANANIDLDLNLGTVFGVAGVNGLPRIAADVAASWRWEPNGVPRLAKFRPWRSTDAGRLIWDRSSPISWHPLYTPPIRRSLRSGRCWKH